MVHTYQNNGQWMGEHRFCFQHPPAAPSSDPDTLNEDAERFRNSTDFTARMSEWAESLHDRLGISVDIENFMDHDYWRAAWLTSSLYAPADEPENIQKHPLHFLKNLKQEERKKLLLEYIQTYFPETVKRKPGVFNIIKNAKATDLGVVSNNLKAIQTFMMMGAEMEDVDQDMLANDSASFFATAKELNEHVLHELTQRYRRESGLSGIAYLDFVSAIKRDPLTAQSVIANPASLNTFLRGMHSPFAVAVREGLFAAPELQYMAEQFRNGTIEKEHAIQDSVKEQQEVKNKIDVMEKRNVVEKIKNGFSNLETWQKWAVVLGGAALLHVGWTKKYPRIFKRPFQYATAMGLPIAGFYLFGVRDMVKGTALDGMLSTVENEAKEYSQYFRDRLGMIPELTEDQLRIYAEFLQEIAGEALTGQVEAMGYISEVPIEAIADSFVLAYGARDGVLDLGNNSLLTRAVKSAFGSSKQDYTILHRIREYKGDLEDSMAHAFFILGAIQYPDDFHVVEELRAGRSYDDMPDGSLERNTYEWLAQQGMKVAKKEYAGNSWLDVITKILTNIPPAATYPPSSPGGGVRRHYPSGSPGGGIGRSYPSGSPPLSSGHRYPGSMPPSSRSGRSIPPSSPPSSP